MDLTINTIWAFVIILMTATGAFYLHSKTKIEKLRIKHPKMADVFDFVGTLALRASNYQASIDDKDGATKLNDATDEVYKQIKVLYPQLTIDEATVRNFVQHAYDEVVKDSSTADAKPVEKIEVPKVTAPIVASKPEPKGQEAKPSVSTPVTQPVEKNESEDVLDDLHL